MRRTICELERGARRAFCLAVLLAAAAPALLVPAAASAQAQTGVAQGIAAVVNDDIITTGDLQARIRMTLIFSNLPADTATQARVAPQVLRRMIDERLQLQEAKRLGNTIRPAQVDAALGRLAATNNMDEADLIAVLERQGVPEAVLRDQIRAELAWFGLIQSEVRGQVVVTDEQVDLASGGGRAAKDTAEVRLGEILLPVYEPGQEEEVLQNARDLVGELRADADFEALARQFSIAASRDAGGDLGWAPTGDLATALKPVVADLAVGEVSDPLRTPAGVYILKLLDRRSGGAPQAPDRARKRQELEGAQVQRLANRYMRDLRADAFIDVRL